jgi:hypothetical protein
MELPFAVESSEDTDAGSLVATSSQGSLLLSRESYSLQPMISINTSRSFSSSLAATGGRVASVLSQLATTAASTRHSTRQAQQPAQTLHSAPSRSPSKLENQQQKQQPQALETVDFTYVNVWETDADEVDILLLSSDDPFLSRDDPKGDILTLLLNRVGPEEGSTVSDSENSTDFLVSLLERANESGTKAAHAKRRGDLQQALDHHKASAKMFHEAAVLSKQSHGRWCIHAPR